MKTPKYGRLGIVAAATLGLAITGPLSARDRHKHHKSDDKVAGAIAGALIVGAIAAAASKKKRHSEREYYYRDDRRYYRDHSWGETFRPSNTANVVCFRNARVCYRDGHYAERWTRQEFGYDRRYR